MNQQRMNKIFPCILAVVITGSAFNAQARPTYICQVNGKAGYSSEKINSTCRLSEMNGISEELVDGQELLSKPAVATKGGNQPVFSASQAADSVDAPINTPAAASAPAVTVPATAKKRSTAVSASTDPSWLLFGKSDYFDVIPDPVEKTGVVPTLAQISSSPPEEVSSGRSAVASNNVTSKREITEEPGANTSPEKPTADSVSVEKQNDNGSDTITKIWEKDQFGSYDDIKIIPRTEVSSKPASLDVKLRNQPRKSAGSNNQRAPVITPPPQPAKPQLSRKQILQREIANEQAALVRAQALLAKAKKAGSNTQALEQTVRDRQANVRAIQGELNRAR